MDTTSAAAVTNLKRRTARDELLAELDQRTLRPGFFGRVVLAWHVRDGVVQGELLPTVEEVRRVQ